MNYIKETRLKRWASSFLFLSREKNNSFNEENTKTKKLHKKEIKIMVITNDGFVITYEEFLELVRSERC